MSLTAETWVDMSHLGNSCALWERTGTEQWNDQPSWASVLKLGLRLPAMKNQVKKLLSHHILEDPEELPDGFSEENSTSDMLKQKPNLSTCTHSTDENGGTTVIEEFRLDYSKVRSLACYLMFCCW